MVFARSTARTDLTLRLAPQGLKPRFSTGPDGAAVSRALSKQPQDFESIDLRLQIDLGRAFSSEFVRQSDDG